MPGPRMLIATPEITWSTPNCTVAIGVQQSAESAAERADQQAPPRAECQCAPRAEPRAEHHHAFEADVDHAGTLGKQTRRGRPTGSARPSAASPASCPLLSAGWCRRNPARRSARRHRRPRTASNVPRPACSSERSRRSCRHPAERCRCGFGLFSFTQALRDLIRDDRRQDDESLHDLDDLA